MNILATPILGLMVVETMPNQDMRGVFSRLYCEQEQD
jgi:dTDP-4-dehydrorhamnose 3,5-epimerase-like enzyme